MSKKTEDGITSASSLDPNCWMCGNEISSVYSESETSHKEWCREITRKIYDNFQGLFRETYNILELSLDDKKAEIAKSTIGNKIMETRNQSIQEVIDYMTK